MYIGVAISGGVDSLYAALRLKEEGHSVLALHGILLNTDEEELDTLCTRLRQTTASLHIPLKIVDLRNDFMEKVLDPSLSAWSTGRTPNPCALCNRYIKFGSLFSAARDLGCDAFATGHYACRTDRSGTIRIGPPCDRKKDQSYFLSLVRPDVLSSCRFPLNDRTKAFCRACIRERGISLPVEQESQDICFIPRTCTPEHFLEDAWQKRQIPRPEEGQILLVDGTGGSVQPVGTHRGLYCYTEGQRRGLGIPFREGLYVLEKDPCQNTLIVGPRSCLGMIMCSGSHVNTFAAPEDIPETCLVKVRYRQIPCPAHVTLTEDTLTLRFDTPVFPTAPGQIISVLNESHEILAGAVVDRITCSYRKTLRN